MKNFFLTLVFSALIIPAISFACDSYGVSYNAHELDRAVSHFHRLVHNYSGYSHLSNDAHKLANSARHLHQLADRGSRSCGHLVNDFRSVEKDYRHLAQEFRRAHNTHHNYHVVHDWRNVADAFRYLRMTIRSGRHGGGHHGGGYNGGGHGGGHF